MKAKHLSLAIAALLAAGGLWLARPAWRAHSVHKSSMGVGFKTPDGRPKPGQVLRPPDPTRQVTDFTPDQAPHGPPKPGQMPRPPIPNRLFTDFTPEQRVQFARQGHGPGG